MFGNFTFQQILLTRQQENKGVRQGNDCAPKSHASFLMSYAFMVMEVCERPGRTNTLICSFNLLSNVMGNVYIIILGLLTSKNSNYMGPPN
jgi:hypothetical protein